jgi:8-oxo-dGTP pyrophosphatase MutT (NUDIX family)
VERRTVVTSFVQHEGKVLLLKRSPQVGTMRGLWAGVSGYLEAGEEPLQRAYRELQEELGIEPERLHLLRRGKPVEAPDLLRADLLWIVHPFLFRLDRPTIQLDWEHDDFRWIWPREMGQFATVPSLPEALAAVLSQRAAPR